MLFWSPPEKWFCSEWIFYFLFSISFPLFQFPADSKIFSKGYMFLFFTSSRLIGCLPQTELYGIITVDSWKATAITVRQCFLCHNCQVYSIILAHNNILLYRFHWIHYCYLAYLQHSVQDTLYSNTIQNA